MFDEKEPKTRKTKPKLQSKARNTGPGHVHRNAGHDAGIAGHVHRNTQFAAGLAGGAGYALIPFLSNDSLLQARANGAVAQMGNLGSTLGPPMFAALMAHLGLPGMILPVVCFALLGVGLASWGLRYRARRES